MNIQRLPFLLSMGPHSLHLMLVVEVIHPKTTTMAAVGDMVLADVGDLLMMPNLTVILVLLLSQFVKYVIEQIMLVLTVFIALICLINASNHRKSFKPWLQVLRWLQANICFHLVFRHRGHQSCHSGPGQSSSSLRLPRC